MAIINNGTQNLIKESQIPTGYIRPVVDDFDDGLWLTVNFLIETSKTSVENADPIVTMTAIVDAVTAAVDLILANDYIASNNVEAYSKMTKLATNYTPDGGDDPWLKSDVVIYQCTVITYVKVA